MKEKFFFWVCVLLFSYGLEVNGEQVIRMSTDHVDLIYKVAGNGRLYQSYLGKRLCYDADVASLPQGDEAYITSGMEDFFEPAIQVVHADANPSLLLKYVSHSVTQVGPDVTETVITMKDDKYPLTVKLHYVLYLKEDLIKTFSEITHQEKKPVVLYKYATSMLHLNRAHYYLTQFSGEWASEARMKETPLDFGKKILDSKLGTRADMFCSPFFQVSLDGPASENAGEVLEGSLGWTGNFRFVFEVDNNNALRIISGINPYASAYPLKAGEVFRTPDFYFTYSLKGRGQASRNFHDWARKYQINKGSDTRMTLLNNWETTYFDFDEAKLDKLMADAKELGVDLFLLDDGWFGNKYPRNSDTQGLGDWTENAKKLPHGIGFLTDIAKQKGVKFGIWIEPEMVNPKSELYEKHPDWVIHLSNRDPYYFRNQMVLDLCNPKVQDYVFGVVDGLMTRCPDIAFFKWDCNSPITNIYSPYLKDHQSQLYVDYVHGLYKVLDRIKAKYPDLPMMLCAGGGGRTDFEALKYFTEFWPSDDTDPVERLYIQWGYSQLFPVKTICAHVTSWNKSTGIKFRTDVAMMCKLGFDLKLADMTKDEVAFCREAVKNYDQFKSVVLDGDEYRLVSPYEGNHTSTMYVDKSKNKALVFAFDMHPRYAEKTYPVRLQGLDPHRRYQVREVNLIPDAHSVMEADGKVYSGDYLMTVGLYLFTNKQMNSCVVEIILD